MFILVFLEVQALDRFISEVPFPHKTNLKERFLFKGQEEV